MEINTPTLLSVCGVGYTQPRTQISTVPGGDKHLAGLTEEHPMLSYTV